MVTRSPAVVQRLAQVAQAAHAAGRGGKAAIYQAACTELGMSMATLMRALHEVAVRPARKQRSDAGATALTRDDAVLLSAMLMESCRKNNRKRLLSIGQAVSILRANGEIRAEAVDAQSGEITPLSDSAIAQALRGHGLHPDQLLQPAPAVHLRSLHPNHVWQIDASLCVLYYLHARSAAETGLQVMEADRFYKNKPRNLKSIEADRVWSYEVADHTSNCLFVNYVMGAESAQNLVDSFMEAVTPREGDPFHGCPFIVQMDLGSAPALFLNLLRRLDIKPEPHAARNPRALGSGEKARDIIERSFEPALRLRPVRDLADLNANARRWARHFNATAEHSRHGRTRTEVWLTIKPEQLRLAPPMDVLRALVSHAPEARKVSAFLEVEFGGRTYSVRDVPNVTVGEKLMVALAPYHRDAVLVVDRDAEGQEVLHVAPLVARDDHGFAAAANVIGEDYSRPPVTRADLARAEVAQAALGDGSAAELAEWRKRIARGQAVPFGGRIDPYKPQTDAPPLPVLPRAGTPLVPKATVAEPTADDTVLTLFQAAKALAAAGVAMDAQRNAQVAQWYPQGVPEGEIAALAQRLTARAGLRLVGGGQ